MKSHIILFALVALTFKKIFLPAHAKIDIGLVGNDKNEEKRGFISDTASIVSNFVNESCAGLFVLNTTGESPNGDKPGDDIESLIKHAGYNSRRYKTETKDGYILSLFRVFKQDEPSKDEKVGTPIILVHGFLGSVKDWVINDKDKALPYKLVSEGRDVWLAGNRGTPESREHKELDQKFRKYWSFSHIEMGNYDAPAFVDKVKEVTGQEKVYWIGFGHGNKEFFTWISSGPMGSAKNCSKIKAMWAIAPQLYSYNTRSPIARALSIAAKPAGLAIKVMGSEEFAGKNALIDTAKNYVCTMAGACPICDNLMMALSGFNKKQSQPFWQSILLAAVPSSTSTQNLVHYGQDVFSDRLGLFDYGPVRNTVLYGMSYAITPPQINPGTMKTEPECKGKINIMYAENDWLADIKDAEKLKDVLGPAVKNFNKIADPKWSHFDYLYGKEADKLVYDPLIKQLKEYEEGDKKGETAKKGDAAKKGETDAAKKGETDATKKGDKKEEKAKPVEEEDVE